MHMSNETTLIFTGDIGFDKYMYGRWSDENLLSEDVLGFLRSANHRIVNVEGALSYGEKSNGTTPELTHSMNPEAVRFLRKINADVWNICNNHIMDVGARGMSDTLEQAESAGIKTLGAGMNLKEAMEPVIFEDAGGIGMIGVGYQRACRAAGDCTPGCFSWSELEKIRESIKKIKETCRWCIVVAHAGEEFTPLPSPYTRQRYLDYLEMGADIVVAHHPHVPMNYETVGEKIIFYSLGNFIFDTDYQRSQFNTDIGLFVKLHFTESEVSFEPFAIRIDRQTETVEKTELPAIFTDVCEKEYNRLIPLSTAAFIENTKRQLRFLKPETFNNATEQDFINDFYRPMRSGCVPGETLDFTILYPLAQRAAQGEWKESALHNVKDYILEQIIK